MTVTSTKPKMESSSGAVSSIVSFVRRNPLLMLVSLLLIWIIVTLLRQAASSPDETQKFMRLTYAGLADGTLLALIALGITLVYKSTDVINFAHGEFMVLGGFIAYQMLVWLEPLMAAPFAVIVSIIGMVIFTMFFGILLERLVLRPMIGEPVISVIMITIGLSNIIAAIVGLIWGNNPRSLPISVLPSDLFTEAGRFEIHIEGARRPLFLDHQNLFVIAVVIAVTAALLLFFQRSKYGIALRATADDQQAAMSMGISIRVIFAFAWSLAAITAGLAGLMIGETTVGVNAQDIPVIGLRAFPVLILGGLDSITGAIVGGVLIGLVETYSGGYISPSLRDVMPYLVLLVVLMIRPYGLFGKQIIERV